MSSSNISNINDNATFWLAGDAERGATEVRFLNDMLTTLEAKVLEEKRCHWYRLQHLRMNVVPLILDMARHILTYNEHYEDALRELVRELVPPFGLRRMILTRVLEADPWLVAGGPAPVSVGDVEEADGLTAEFDVFSPLLGLNDLFGWAMEPTPSGL
ncbi:hypothetical protein [Absidia glauca]|uniref:Uncharacterized protein n=1 Tax=Absidia glauca TaxID=4829 RepID=A0A168PYY9_ABSGL|nr:hypothetical protein [Absidia glauca]